LYSDGHITGKDASLLESKKLFKPPTASSSTGSAATASVIHTTPHSATAPTNPTSAVINLMKDIGLNYQGPAGSAVNNVTTTATTVRASRTTAAPVCQTPSLTSQAISTASQPAITVTPNTPLSLPQGSSGVLKLSMKAGQSSLQQSSLQVTDNVLSETDNLTVSENSSQPASSVASSENGDSNDEHYYDDLTTDPDLEHDAAPTGNCSALSCILLMYLLLLHMNDVNIVNIFPNSAANVLIYILTVS